MIIFLVSIVSQLMSITQLSLSLPFYNPLATTACFTTLLYKSDSLTVKHISHHLTFLMLKKISYTPPNNIYEQYNFFTLLSVSFCVMIFFLIRFPSLHFQSNRNLLLHEYILLALPCTLPFMRQYITKPSTKVIISDYGSLGKSKGMLCWICDCQSGPAAACFQHYFLL